MTNETNRKVACQFVAAFAIVAASAASTAAQVVVVGTGNPDVDVPAVQAAVDHGGEVILKGHFSFDTPPTKPTLFSPYMATIRVSNQVVIVGTSDDQPGTSDEQGGMTSITAGTAPFYVEAPGARVEIRGLRFIRPKAGAIVVSAVGGLVVAACKIEGVEPLNHDSDAIAIYTTFNPPNPTANPGQPENISGTLSIADNDIDVGGTALDRTIGIFVFSAGKSPDKEVDIDVSRNTIRNTTEPAIVFRRVGGRASIERNVIRTGSLVGPTARPQAIRVANLGSYLIAHNSIDCGWTDPNAEGIAVFSQIAEWPIERAIVVDNKVTMAPPEGTVFDNFSAGIGVYGFAHGNVVLDNRIRGRARAALYTTVYMTGVPSDNAFFLNRFDDFDASVADIFVDAGVMNTLIAGEGTVEDHGVGTVIFQLPNPGGHREEGSAQKERDR